jgi:hypothetical protein
VIGAQVRGGDALVPGGGTRLEPVVTTLILSCATVTADEVLVVGRRASAAACRNVRVVRLTTPSDAAKFRRE